MPLNTIDPVTALLIIDLQQGIVSFQDPLAARSVVANAAALAAAFRAKELPVVVVTVNGRAPGRVDRPRPANSMTPPPGFLDPVPELGVVDSDIRVVKRTWGAFRGTGLEEALRTRGVTQVVLVGIATSMGVESTARAAHESGLNVTVVLDAITDPDPAAHAASVRAIFPQISETGHTSEVLALLNADAVS